MSFLYFETLGSSLGSAKVCVVCVCACVCVSFCVTNNQNRSVIQQKKKKFEQKIWWFHPYFLILLTGPPSSFLVSLSRDCLPVKALPAHALHQSLPSCSIH
jgi:hypothetical protein